MSRFNVVQYAPCGAFVAVISGMGRNRGRLDAEHSRRSAQRHAAQLRIERPAAVFRVEPST